MEWHWGHLAQVTLELVGLFPVVGVPKYGDELALAKSEDLLQESLDRSNT